MKIKIEEMVGKQYGRWTVLGGERRPTTHQKPAVQTLCQCECGIKRWVQATALRSGRSTSCGCKAKEMHSRMIQRYAPLPKTFTEAA